MECVGASPGRSAHALSIESGRILYQTRKLLARLLGARDSRHILFTLNATMSINTTLQGLLKPNDVVVTTQAEHNAIKRPLNALRERLNLEVREIPCDAAMQLDLKAADSLLTGAKLLACAHINNVCGTRVPLDSLAELAKKHGALFLLDAAQSVGCVPMESVMERVDFLAFSAHKGLLSPMGIGGLVLSESGAQNLSPLVFGGTGSASEEEIQPCFLPDKFESGTPNMHGIAGLRAGLKWIAQKGVCEIEHEERVMRQILKEGLLDITGVKVYEGNGSSGGALSVDVERKSLSQVGEMLSRDYGICTRVGLHCSPSSHRVLGSFVKGGTIRLSVSVFTTREEIERTIEAFKEIVRR